MLNTSRLTELQLELLKIYSFNPTDEELKDIQKYLGEYFSERLSKNISKAAENKGITDKDLNELLGG